MGAGRCTTPSHRPSTLAVTPSPPQERHPTQVRTRRNWHGPHSSSECCTRAVDAQTTCLECAELVSPVLGAGGSNLSSASTMPVPTYERAMELLMSRTGGGGLHTPPGVDYFPHNFLLRLSVKLFDCQPAELPSDVREQLVGWLTVAPTGAAPVTPAPLHATPIGGLIGGVHRVVRT